MFDNMYFKLFFPRNLTQFHFKLTTVPNKPKIRLHCNQALESTERVHYNFKPSLFINVGRKNTLNYDCLPRVVQLLALIDPSFVTEIRGLRISPQFGTTYSYAWS